MRIAFQSKNPQILNVLAAAFFTVFTVVPPLGYASNLSIASDDNDSGSIRATGSKDSAGAAAAASIKPVISIVTAQASLAAVVASRNLSSASESSESIASTTEQSRVSNTYKLQASKGDDKITVIIPATKSADGREIPGYRVSLAQYGQKTFPVGTLFIVPPGSSLQVTIPDGDREVPVSFEGTSNNPVDPQVSLFVPDDVSLSDPLKSTVDNQVNSDNKEDNNKVNKP